MWSLCNSMESQVQTGSVLWLHLSRSVKTNPSSALALETSIVARKVVFSPCVCRIPVHDVSFSHDS